MRTPVIAGNWKCHTTSKEAVALIAQLRRALERQLGHTAEGVYGPLAQSPAASVSERRKACEGRIDSNPQPLVSPPRADAIHGVEVVVCPPFTALPAVAAQLAGTALGLGAQDVFWEAAGAFTGEISPPMLIDIGCRYVIVGHSERRIHFGETDEMVQRKLRAALAHGLTPIVCIGETLAQREAGQTFDVLARQLGGALGQCPDDTCRRMILAYEPVWAIGTGNNATPEQAQEAHRAIRQWVTERCGPAAGEAIRIQYGGSVTAANAAGLLRQPDVDGALVGGVSLKPEAFSAIVKAASETKAVAR